MKRKVRVILTAAGKGKRFSTGSKFKKPKQYITLSGRPVILYSLACFQKCKYVDEILISAESMYFDYLHSLAARYKITKLIGLIEGGKTRFESVRNAFLEIKGKTGDLVLIHDAARPNISTEIVNTIIEKSGKSQSGVIYAVKVSETVKRSANGFVKETLNRENLWLVQTPQVFSYEVLGKAYKKLKSKTDFTDESALMESAGYKVKLVEGNPDNIKITSASDISLLKKLMKK